MKNKLINILLIFSLSLFSLSFQSASKSRDLSVLLDLGLLKNAFDENSICQVDTDENSFAKAQDTQKLIRILNNPGQPTEDALASNHLNFLELWSMLLDHQGKIELACNFITHRLLGQPLIIKNRQGWAVDLQGLLEDCLESNGLPYIVPLLTNQELSIDNVLTVDAGKSFTLHYVFIEVPNNNLYVGDVFLLGFFVRAKFLRDWKGELIIKAFYQEFFSKLQSDNLNSEEENLQSTMETVLEVLSIILDPRIKSIIAIANDGKKNIDLTGDEQKLAELLTGERTPEELVMMFSRQEAFKQDSPLRSIAQHKDILGSSFLHIWSFMAALYNSLVAKGFFKQTCTLRPFTNELGDMEGQLKRFVETWHTLDTARKVPLLYFYQGDHDSLHPREGIELDLPDGTHVSYKLIFVKEGAGKGDLYLSAFAPVPWPSISIPSPHFPKQTSQEIEFANDGEDIDDNVLEIYDDENQAESILRKLNVLLQSTKMKESKEMNIIQLDAPDHDGDERKDAGNNDKTGDEKENKLFKKEEIDSNENEVRTEQSESEQKIEIANLEHSEIEKEEKNKDITEEEPAKIEQSESEQNITEGEPVKQSQENNSESTNENYQISKNGKPEEHYIVINEQDSRNNFLEKINQNGVDSGEQTSEQKNSSESKILQQSAKGSDGKSDSKHPNNESDRAIDINLKNSTKMKNDQPRPKRHDSKETKPGKQATPNSARNSSTHSHVKGDMKKNQGTTIRQDISKENRKKGYLRIFLIFLLILVLPVFIITVGYVFIRWQLMNRMLIQKFSLPTSTASSA